jgi:hypothetical protein
LLPRFKQSSFDDQEIKTTLFSAHMKETRDEVGGGN